MTMARAHLVDPTVTRWYHCVNRCVRRAFLLGEGDTDRKQWIEDRLEELAQIFAISVAGFTVLDNHLHVLVRLDPDVAAGWSDGMWCIGEVCSRPAITCGNRSRSWTSGSDSAARCGLGGDGAAAAGGPRLVSEIV